MAQTKETLQQDLAQMLAQATAHIQATTEVAAVEALRVHYLGKKGLLTEQLKHLGGLSPEERPVFGKLVNDAKEMLTTALVTHREQLETQAQAQQLATERVDVTLPGRGLRPGGLHPVTRTLERLET
ncbi:MAG TPA: phenylalanine--tRNA ligase subunit alpha, partial [Burkholderiales bacterium]|nr:phenylalanine--tRNA ligase subunit alpha [Burkholderiales bacterium]